MATGSTGLLAADLRFSLCYVGLLVVAVPVGPPLDSYVMTELPDFLD